MAGQVAAVGGSLAHARDVLMAAAADAEADAPEEALLMYAAAVDACFYLLDAAARGPRPAAAERLLALR